MNLFSKIGLALDAFRAVSPPESCEVLAAESRAVGGEGMVTRSLPPHLAAFLGSGNETAGRLSDPYKLSPWVSSAIKHITGPIASVNLKFTTVGKGGEVEQDDPLLNAFWQRPGKGLSKGSRMSRVDFIEATAGWLCLAGEFFWILDDSWLPVRAAVRSPLMIARPDRMRPIMEDGELIGWEFRNAHRGVAHLIPDQVISSKFWNPTDDIRGAAPMDAAKMAAEADYAAARFWKSLAESNGDLGETIIAPNGITPEQEEQIRMILRRKRAAAKRGDYQPTFLVGDLKTEDAKIKSPDAAAVTQRLQNRHEVYIAFGVPPSFAEVTASYSIGSASDRYKLIEETCMPHGAKIAEAVEMVSLRLTGREVSVSFNWDEHSTMQQVRSERIEAGRKMHERGMPWNVVSDYLNLGLKPFAGWDKAWMPFNLQQVDGGELIVDSKKEEPAAESAGVKAFEELEVLLRGCPAHPSPPAAAPGQVRSLNAKRWEALMLTRAPHVKRIRVTVDRALFEARKETLANIAKAEAEEKMIRSGAFDFIFDLAKFLELLIEPIFKINAAAYEAAGAEVMEEMNETGPFIPADPNGLAWLQARKNYIKDAGTEVWEQIRNSLDEGVQAGESFAKLSARVREDFNGISKERSMRIAVTEVGIAMESGRHDGMIQAGAKYKEWLTSGDDRVRLSHDALDGKVIPMDEPFLVGGVPMMHPCDPAGTAEEIINCRCVHGPASAPKEPTIDDVNNDPTIPF